MFLRRLIKLTRMLRLLLLAILLLLALGPTGECVRLAVTREGDVDLENINATHAFLADFVLRQNRSGAPRALVLSCSRAWC